MRKRILMLAGAFLFGAMFVVGLIYLVQTPDRFAIPTPTMAVVGGSLAMFATVGGFVLAFLEAATQD